MKKPILAPSLLSADFTKLNEEINTCQQGGANWLHVDVMDGHFVPNITVGPFIVEACRRATELPLDVHLMIEKPDTLIPTFVKAGASRLTVHVETCPHLHRTLEHIRSLGISAGVSLNPSTPVDTIKHVLHLVDLVLVMTVNPGFGGQAFIPEMLPKISTVRQMLDASNPSAWLEVDGGISVKTIKLARQAGADAFVAGNSVFTHSQGIEHGLQSLREILLQSD